MTPVYPALPIRLILAAAGAALTGRHRSLQQDARWWARHLPVEVRNGENLPHQGPAALVMNHYHRPGFQAWWFAMALAAAAPVEMHWTMTAAWTDDGTPGARWRAFLSPHFLPRLAKVYGFTSMPPMPPRPHEVSARAAAVRQFLSAARRNPPPVLALAPEGQDSPNGGLMRPHPGVGRLLAILNDLGFVFIPAGVFETDHLVLSVGSPFQIALPDLRSRDRDAADCVMQHIAALLPAGLQNSYIMGI